MGDLFNYIEDIDDLARYDVEQPLLPRIPSPPRQKIYMRNIFNPFDYYTDDEFKERYRFRKETVRSVIVPLLNTVPLQNMRGLPITVEEQATTALRYYATGTFQKPVGDLQYISQATISRIVTNVSYQLAGKVGQFVRFSDDLIHTAHQFQTAQPRYAGLRNVIGAIDCTHIKINRPRGVEHSEAYRNRKGVFSINVQAVVGRDMKIYDIVARWPGSSHDSRIFRNSRLHARLESGQLRGILVGDSGYRATHYMLTPFINPQNRPQMRYNYVQTRTRNVVERTFGAIKKRFECLRRGIGTKLTTAAAIIVACAVLQNIARDANEEAYEDENYREHEPIPVLQHPPAGLAFRNNIVRQNYT